MGGISASKTGMKGTLTERHKTKKSEAAMYTQIVKWQSVRAFWSTVKAGVENKAREVMRAGVTYQQIQRSYYRK